jgi:hypothetical protein
MTIGACYLSGEGVVFGAGSTSTMYVSGVGPGAAGSEHHYNFAQKIFQIGENSTLGLTMLGLGNLRSVGYRTLVAQFADTLVVHGAQTMHDVASLWSQFFWSTPQDLFDLVRLCCLGEPSDLPIREAIDWVHASIYTTVKTMKFSHMAARVWRAGLCEGCARPL